jgi:hypothetical protein
VTAYFLKLKYPAPTIRKPKRKRVARHKMPSTFAFYSNNTRRRTGERSGPPTAPYQRLTPSITSWYSGTKRTSSSLSI